MLSYFEIAIEVVFDLRINVNNELPIYTFWLNNWCCLSLSLLRTKATHDCKC